MRGLNEIEALQRAWSDRAPAWSWVCQFIHEGRVPRPGSEPRELSRDCDASRLIPETRVTSVTLAPPQSRWGVLAWTLLRICAACARVFGR